MKTIICLTLTFFAPFALRSQTQFHCAYDQSINQSNFDLNKGETLCMKYGYSHTPKGNLHTMMVFVTFTEDLANNNGENNIAFWPKDGIPNYASNFLNLVPNSGPISTKSSNLTGYYETMSGYNGLGGFSLTGKIFHVTISKQFTYDPTFTKKINLANFEILLCQRAVAALQIQYPNEDWSLYDKRDNPKGIGTYKSYSFDNSAFLSDKIIDYLSFNFRLLPSDLNLFRSGDDGVLRSGYSYGIGMKNEYSLPDLIRNGQSYQIDCGHTLFDPLNEISFFAYCTHEMGHGIFGLRHNMGANNVTGYNFNAYYGWGMMADISKFFNTSNAWENYTYGWSNPQIATPANQSYVIKDFVTTKDAIKIPIPNTNQALWIENHQLINDFDNKNTTNSGVMAPGLYMYISDFETPENCFIVPDRATYYEDIPYSRMVYWSNRLKVLSKEGNKDFAIIPNNNSYNFIPLFDNPFSGVHTAQSIRIDENQDNIIDYKSESSNGGRNEQTRIYKLNGVNVSNWSGNSSSAFGSGDNLSISGILPILNYPYVEDQSDRIKISDFNNPIKPFQLTPFVLNGLRVYVLGFNNTTKEYSLFISFNDIELSNDKIWTGRIELPNIISGNASDLVLKSGKTLTIKRSGTANTHINSAEKNIVNYAWPSKFTCKENSKFLTEANSNVIIKEQSSFELDAGAILEIGNGSVFTVKESSSFILYPNSTLIIKENGKLIIEDGSAFKYFNNGQVVLEGANSIIEFKGGGRLQVAANATFNYSGNGFIKITTNNSIYPIFEAIGDNARVKLITRGFNFNTKKILEITGGSYVCDINAQNSIPLPLYELKELSIQNGVVQLDKNTGIAISGKGTKSDLRNLIVKARIDDNVNERHLGLVLNGQKDNLVYRVLIKDAINGLTSNNFYGGNSVDVLQYTAISCDIGLQINGVGARIQDHKMSYCKTGIFLQGMYGGTRLYRGEIFNCSVGILAVNCGSTVIELYQPNIYNNFNGIYATNSTFTGACGKIYDNASATLNNGKYLGANVHLSTLGNLVLDPTFRSGIGNLNLTNVRSVSARLSNASVGPLISNSQSSLITNLDFSLVGNINRSISLPSINIQASRNLWRYSGGSSVSPVNNVDYKVNSSKIFGVNLPAFYNDPNPILLYQNCGTGSVGGSGGNDRFRGYLAAPVSLLDNVTDFVLPDGNTAKNSVFDAYQYAFDLVPNYEFAINNFKKVINHQYSPEQFVNWKIPLIVFNSQMIETLKEGIEEKRIDITQNFEIINDILAIQDKLMIDFIEDSQNYAGFQLSKAEVQRLINDYQGSLQTISEIDLNFSPVYQDLKLSYNCMLSNEYNSRANFNNLLMNNYGLGCFTEIDFNGMEPFIDTTNNQNEKVDLETIIDNFDSHKLLKVYPIPAHEQLSITIDSGVSIPCEFELIDNLGKIILKNSTSLVKDFIFTIDIRNLESGSYQLKARFLDKVEIHKIIIF